MASLSGSTAYSNSTTDCTWTVWTGSDSGTSAAYTTASTWNYWNDNSTATTTGITCTDDSWYYWTGSNVQEVRYVQPKLTKEQIEAQALEAKKRAEEMAERLKQIEATRKEKERLEKEAEARALVTLKENLDQEQIENLEKGSFIMVSVNSGNRYKINKGRVRNIEQVDAEGKRLRFLCVHPKDNVPNYDTMLSQKLMLEHCEDEVRKIANFS